MFSAKGTNCRALLVLCSILGLLVLAPRAVHAQDFVLHLNEVNLSTDPGLSAPSVNGTFYLLAIGIIDPTTGQVTIIPQADPVTQVSFGITTNFPFDPSQLKFSVGLDDYDNLAPLTNVTVQQEPFSFSNNSALPIYLVQGDLTQPFVPSAGQHALDIVDETNLPIGLGFVGERNSSAEFEVDSIAVPEPASWIMVGGALTFLAFWRHQKTGFSYGAPFWTYFIQKLLAYLHRQSTLFDGHELLQTNF